MLPKRGCLPFFLYDGKSKSASLANMASCRHTPSTVASPLVISTGLRLMRDFGEPYPLPFHLQPDVDFRFYPVDRIPRERQGLADSHTSDGNEDHEHLHQRVGYVVDHRSSFRAAQFHRFEIRLAGRGDELHGVVFLTARNV